jgi:predicted acetyltransferase
MTALVFPTMGRYEEWADCVAEYLDAFPNGSGLPEIDGPQDAGPEAYAASVTQSELFRDESAVLPGTRLHGDYLWITDGDELVGFLRFTFTLNANLLELGGHVGYSIRPSRRRQGHASRALGLALERARGRGIDRILVTCDDTNVASARTIESQGGQLEDVRNGKRRYWIDLQPVAEGG